MSLAEYALQLLRDSKEFIPHLGPTKQAEAASVHVDDCGWATLDRFIEGPMEVTGFAVRLATGLSGLPKRELVRKDLKPLNVVADCANGRIWIADLAHRQ